MGLGVITDSDIRAELISRGITVSLPGVTTPSVPVSPVPPAVTFIPPAEPQEPVTVLPAPGRDHIYPYEPYLPIYPPAVVYPQDVEEEVFPYVTPGVPAKTGLSTGLVVVLGITAFALVALSKPKTTQRSRRPRRTREFYEEDVL